MKTRSLELIVKENCNFEWTKFQLVFWINKCNPEFWSFEVKKVFATILYLKFKKISALFEKNYGIFFLLPSFFNMWKRLFSKCWTFILFSSLHNRLLLIKTPMQRKIITICRLITKLVCFNFKLKFVPIPKLCFLTGIVSKDISSNFHVLNESECS